MNDTFAEALDEVFADRDKHVQEMFAQDECQRCGKVFEGDMKIIIHPDYNGFVCYETCSHDSPTRLY